MLYLCNSANFATLETQQQQAGLLCAVKRCTCCNLIVCPTQAGQELAGLFTYRNYIQADSEFVMIGMSMLT